MGLFDSLQPLTHEQAAVVADQLQANEPVAIRVDPRPVFVVIIPSRLSYEVDIICTGDNLYADPPPWPPSPFPLTRPQHTILATWARKAIPLICQTWQERYPEN